MSTPNDTSTNSPANQPPPSPAPPPATPTSQTPAPSTTPAPPAPPLPAGSSSSSSSSTPLPPPPTSKPPVINTTVVTTSSTSPPTVTQIQTLTAPPQLPNPAPSEDVSTTSSTDSASQTSSSAAAQNESSSGGLTGTTKVVVAVVVPIVGVALIAIVLLLLWKRRQKSRKAEEARMKEAEDYRFNPNSPPNAGVVLSNTGEEVPYDMAESGAGYRGWGSTSGGRKTSNMAGSAVTGTTLPVGAAYSEQGTYRSAEGITTSPSASTFPGGATSDGNGSNAPLIFSGERPDTGNSGIPAAGPPIAGGGIHRGISNASSDYSGITRSDNSDMGLPASPHGDAQYYGVDGSYDDQNYSGHPYQVYPDGGGYGSSPPVIRDVSARRNTRIETPTSAHFPQQGSGGIAQNF